jgi:hypothetical protein
MASDYPPGFTAFSSPNSCVSERPSNLVALNVNGQTRAQRGDRDIGTDTADSELFRLVRVEAHDAGCVGLKILRLGSELAVGTCEQEFVSDKAVQRVDVGGQLRKSNAGLESDDFRIRGSTKTDSRGLPELAFIYVIVKYPM